MKAQAKVDTTSKEKKTDKDAILKKEEEKLSIKDQSDEDLEKIVADPDGAMKHLKTPAA